MTVGCVDISRPPVTREVFFFFDQNDFPLKGGDRVDADGIPLYMITHWQKAQLLDQGRDIIPRLTLLWMDEVIIRGVPVKRMVPG